MSVTITSGDARSDPGDAADPGAGRHVQYGFRTSGENVWVIDTAPFGTVVIAVPEPASLALLGAGGLALLGRRRRA